MARRIGIMTDGGDCPGMNAVIRAIGKTAMSKHGMEAVGFRDGYKGLVANNFIKLRQEHVSGILDKGGSILGLSGNRDPFRFKMDKDGEYGYSDQSDRAAESFRMHRLDCLIAVGNAETLRIAARLQEKGLNVIALPKSVENDVSGTDMTVGFTTAVDFAVGAIDKLHSSAESSHKLMILEVLGSRSGWVAVESGLAGGADVLLTPEFTYDVGKVARKVLQRRNDGKSFSIIVMSEGAVSAEDGLAGVSADTEGLGGRDRLGAAGIRLATGLERLTGIECQVTVLGNLLRGGRPVPYDRTLATAYGMKAVEMACEGTYGSMVAFVGGSMVAVPISDALRGFRRLTMESEVVRSCLNLGMSFGA